MRLMEVSEQLPKDLYASSASASRYHPILFDFAYLKAIEACEKRIDASPSLVAIDQEFREVGDGPSSYGCLVDNRT